MYPRISDFFNDVLGTNFCLPIQSFGFFMAMAFVAAYFILRKEYQRQTDLGVFPTWKAEEEQGGPMGINEVIFNTVIYALLGFKLFLMFEDYDVFCDNPQDAILSAKGSILGAIIFAVLGGGYKFYQYQKRKDSKPQLLEVTKSINDELGTIFTIAFISGIIGAKLFHNFEYWDDFMKDPVGQLVSFSGLTFYGGLLAGTVSVLYYVNRRGYQLLPFVDGASMILILGYGIGRIGCQVAGDGDWGIANPADKPTWLSWAPDWLWAYDYPHNVLRDGVPLENCAAHWGHYCTHLEVPVYPTPIYETTMAFLIFGFLWFMRKRVTYWGQILSMYLMLNGIERFLIEKIRKNPPQFGEVGFTQAEIISSGLFLIGVIFFVLTTFVWKKNLENTKIKEVKALGKQKG